MDQCEYILVRCTSIHVDYLPTKLTDNYSTQLFRLTCSSRTASFLPSCRIYISASASNTASTARFNSENEDNQLVSTSTDREAVPVSENNAPRQFWLRPKPVAPLCLSQSKDGISHTKNCSSNGDGLLPFGKWVEQRCDRESTFCVHMQEVSNCSSTSLMSKEWPWFFGKSNMYHFDPLLEWC